MGITVATYNIHRCVGRDGRMDPQRTARVIRELGATIVALQEVESFFDGKDGPHQVEILSRTTAMEAISGPSMFRKESEYGNVLLTKEHVLSFRRHDISVLDREPRGALEVSIHLRGAVLRVILTHLGLHAWERRAQIRKLLSIISPTQDTPTLLLGDFNEWLPWRSHLGWIHKQFGRAPAPPTYPSGFPVLSMDRIWVWPPACLNGLRVHRSKTAKIASDHLPLTATLEFELTTLQVAMEAARFAYSGAPILP